ncbi:MAG: hypothetical protein ACP5GW_06270, partial [Caldisericaceae bacterium]
NGQKENLLLELVEESMFALNEGSDPSFTLLKFVFQFLRIVGLGVRFDIGNEEAVYFSSEEGGFNTSKGIAVSESIYNEMKRIDSASSYSFCDKSMAESILDLLNSYIIYHSESKHFVDFVDNLKKINVG